MTKEFKRSTPEEALQKCKCQEKGILKIFIGYAPGVGKTYSMLNEANRRLKRGQDIVIGYLENKDRADTESQIGNLEILPRKIINHNGKLIEEMDLEAIIARHPRTVVIDELPHTNAPGSKNEKRYQDVEEILSHGINVITNCNIQHLEGIKDTVRQITGIHVQETIPDYIIDNANEVVVVDITPDELQDRLKRGNVFKSEPQITRALSNFFKKGNLTALRELALRQTAEEVDEQLTEYMKQHGIKENWQTVERILVCISDSNFARKLICKGSKRANRYKCEWIVANVCCTHWAVPKPSKKDLKILDTCFNLAKQLGAEVTTLTGNSISDELIKFSSERHITQIIIGHSRRTKLQKLLRGSTVVKVLKQAKNIEVHIIPNDK